MIDVKGYGKCEIISVDEYDIVAVPDKTNVPVYLDREDYPELSDQCAYEKTINDMVKADYMETNKGEFVYVNIFNAFDTRQITPYETRTKLEDYITTFNKINGDTFIDDLVAEGTATLVSKREKDGPEVFTDVVSEIEALYRGEDDE